MNQIIKVKFRKWNCIVALAYYNNDRKAISLYDEDDFEPIATATVNMVNEPCEDDEVFIKNYSENEGMTDALIDAEIIKKESTGFVRSGYVLIFKYKLTEKILNLFEYLHQKLEKNKHG